MEATLNYAKEKLSFLSHAMNNCHPTMKRYYSNQYNEWKRHTSKLTKQSNSLIHNTK